MSTMYRILLQKHTLAEILAVCEIVLLQLVIYSVCVKWSWKITFTYLRCPQERSVAHVYRRKMYDCISLHTLQLLASRISITFMLLYARVITMSYKGCNCSVVMCSVPSLCLTICNALTFKNFEIESSFLVWFTSSEYLGQIPISRYIEACISEIEQTGVDRIRWT